MEQRVITTYFSVKKRCTKPIKESSTGTSLVVPVKLSSASVEDVCEQEITRSKVPAKKAQSKNTVPRKRRKLDIPLVTCTVKNVYSSDLKLPKKYEVLVKIFESVDSMCSIMFKRKELITFSKVQAAVQRNLKRNLHLSHLAQIHQVFPEAFMFRQNKIAGSYQLVIEPNFTGDDVSRSYSPIVLTGRMSTFRQKILEIVLSHHQQFLKTVRLSDVPNHLLTQWHSRFDLENVEDIPEAELPCAPEENKIFTAKEALEAAIKFPNNRVEMAVADVSDKSPVKVVKPTSPKKVQSMIDRHLKVQKHLKGIDAGLLERIRAKEAMNNLKTMTRTKEDEEKLRLFERLPEITKILFQFFHTQKKGSLPKDKVLVKLVESCKSAISIMDAQKEIVLLNEIVPKWIEEVKISSGTYLKMDMKQDVNTVITEIEKAHKALR